MNRFTQAYLTIMVLIIILLNLGLIILFGRQFNLNASVGDLCTADCLTNGSWNWIGLVMINLLVIALVAVVYLAIRHFLVVTGRSVRSSDSR